MQFTVENATIAKRIFTLLQKQWNLTTQLHYVTHARFGGIRKYVLTLGPHQSPILLQSLGMMEKSFHNEWKLRTTTPRITLQRTCCMRSYLRGILLGCGTLINPDKGYRLELLIKDEDTHIQTAKCLQRFHLPIRQGKRKEKSYFYWTQADQVITFLSIVEAHQTVILLEEMRVQREVLENVNRAINCDNANIKKQMNANQKQLEEIENLMNKNLLSSLPFSLQEIAKARLKAPEASLTQLGEMLIPPLGKSGVNHRLRRLIHYARQYSQNSQT